MWIFWIVLSVLAPSCGLTTSEDDGCSHPCLTEKSCSYKRVIDKCYYAFHIVKSWRESEQYCISQKLDMVKLGKDLVDTFTLQEVAENLRLSDKVWLGAQAQEFSDWTFVNGVTINETNSPGPSETQVGSKMYECGVMLSDTTITKTDCQNKYHFICRSDDWKGVPIYHITDITATWFEARSFCNKQGGDLFFLNKEESVRFLHQKVSSYQNQRLYIGLTRFSWQWNDGEEIKRYNWMGNEPDSISEKCLAMKINDGLWSNEDCNATAHSFCMRDVVLPTSTIQNMTKVNDEPESNQPYIVIIIVLATALLVMMLSLVCMCLAMLKLKRKQKSIKRDVDALSEAVSHDRSRDQSLGICLSRDQSLGDGLSISADPFPMRIYAGLEDNQEENNQLMVGHGGTLEEEKSKIEELDDRMNLLEQTQVDQVKGIEDKLKNLDFRLDKVEKNFISKDSLRSQENLYGHWPFPIQFHETKQYAIVQLKLWDVDEVNWTLMDLNVFPNEKKVLLQAKLRKENGDENIYEYRKTLPQSIVVSASKVKHEKKAIILEMKKVDENHSWQPYLLHMVARP